MMRATTTTIVARAAKNVVNGTINVACAELRGPRRRRACRAPMCRASATSHHIVHSAVIVAGARDRFEAWRHP